MQEPSETKSAKGTRKIFTSISENAMIYNLMVAHLHKVPDSNLWEYDPDWSDAAISKVVAPDGRLNPGHVATVRLDAFGRLESKPPTRQDPALLRRIGELEAKLADLAARHDKLVTSLAVNRVLDARHLATGKP